MIGSLGPVVFEVSAEKVRTFDGLQRSGSSRWQSHEIMNRKSKREFLGPGEEQISFSIRLDANMGINPSDELFVLRFLRDNGVAIPFILNGQPVGDTWGIESISESWTRIDNHGALIVAEVQVTLYDYVPPST